MKRKGKIGFFKKVRLEWFDYTVNLILAGNDEDAVTEALQDLLKEKVSIGNTTKGCGRDKVIGILKMVWVYSNDELNDFRDEGKQFLSDHSGSLTSRDLHVVIHWGMVMAVYPFWASVALHTGRLLRLQGTVRAGQIQRRMREQYGERESVVKATRKVLRSFIDWGVLTQTAMRGVYTAGTPIVLQDSPLIAWLIEAALYSKETHSMPLRDILESPSLFPFQFVHVQPESLADASSRLELLRQGLDDYLVLLI